MNDQLNQKELDEIKANALAFEKAYQNDNIARVVDIGWDLAHTVVPRLLAEVSRLSLECDTAYNKGREDLLDEQREERICDEECR